MPPSLGEKGRMEVPDASETIDADDPVRPDGLYGRISGGGSAQILNGVTLNTVLSTTVGRDNGNDVSGQLGLNVGF